MLNPVCGHYHYSRTLLQSSSGQGCGYSGPGNTMTIHRTWHTLININTWNFNSLFRVCLIYIRFCELQKHRITLRKIHLPISAGPAYYRMCSNRRLLFKQTGSSSTKGNHHPSFLCFWNWAEEKLSMQPKFVAAQKMLLKQKPSKHSQKWIARFYYFRHLYSAGSAYCSQYQYELPIDMGNSICTAH